MRLSVLAVPSLVLAATFSWVLPAAALDGKEIARRVQERYDATEDFVADVTQEMTVASLGKTMVSNGTVAFKKPGRMRWEFSDTEKQVIVADGETLWFYRPEEQQVFKAAFDNAFRSTTPISFLTGVGKIGDDFNVELDGESEDGEQYILKLVPKTADPDVGQLRLFVTQDSADIHGAEVRDPLGNVSTLRFRNVRRNVGLKDDRFVFEIPPNVDIITAPGQGGSEP
jgi:outer membrane lipoprotein carrier protein